jgi:1-acyl-sn-glycerol-3-phosphate acyltransferase
MSEVDSFLAGNGWLSRAFYAVCRTGLELWLRVWCRLTIEGGEHIPEDVPFVLAPVHRSNLDSPISGAITRRRMRFMGKDSMWRSRPAGWFLSSLGGFPVTRGTADREALKRCIEVLKRGEPLVIFPEGERKSGPVVQPLFDGAVYAAARGRAPIIPVGIGGSERVMPKGSKMIYPRKVHVIVGAPIVVPPELSGKAQRVAVKEVSLTLHGELQRLFDAAQARANR